MWARLINVGPVFDVYVAKVCVFCARNRWQEFVVHSVELHVECGWVFQFGFGGWWHAALRLLIHGVQGNVADHAGGILDRMWYQHTHGESYALVLVETRPSG